MIDIILGPIFGMVKWLSGLLFTSRAASQAQAREHDVALFKKGDTTVNEVFLDDLLNSDLYNHWCNRRDIRAVGRFCTDFRRAESQFLDGRVAEAVGKAILALRQLDSFVGKNFFTSDMPNDNDRLVLHHDLRDSPNEAQRDRYWNVLVPELNTLIDTAWEAYRQYRATVKKRLMV
jgi:hypothetical protein